ncbi:lipopolysaccharide biosynthesis protein [Pseudoalteromonas piscicida]
MKSLPTSFSWWARTGADRLILQFFLGYSAVGIFSVVLQVSLILTVIGIAVNNALMPSIYKSVSDNSANFKLAGVVFFGLAFLLFLLNYILPIFINNFLPEEYRVANNFLKLSLLSSLLHILFIFVSNYFVASGKVGILSLITTFSTVLHTAISFYLLYLGGGVESVFISGILSYSFGLIVSLLFFVVKKNNET